MPTFTAMHFPSDWRDRLAANLQQAAVLCTAERGQYLPYAKEKK